MKFLQLIELCSVGNCNTRMEYQLCEAGNLCDKDTTAHRLLLTAGKVEGDASAFIA